MSKQLIFGLSLTLLLGADPLRAQPLSWPPGEQGLLEQGPLVTLLGPVYESGLETEHQWHQALQRVLKRLGRDPKLLPDLYRERIRELRHFLFRPGYKNDEEWGSIKTLRQSGVDDPERIAGILEVNPNRPEGLELAVRLIPPDEERPNRVTLEGYRFIKQPSGKGEVEWYAVTVPLNWRSPEAGLKDAIVWLLLKPFAAQGKRYPVDDRTIPYWQDARTPGLLWYSQDSLWGAGIGAVVSLAMWAMTKEQKSEDLQRGLIRGSALGLLGGAAYGFYEAQSGGVARRVAPEAALAAYDARRQRLTLQAALPRFRALGNGKLQGVWTLFRASF